MKVADLADTAQLFVLFIWSCVCFYSGSISWKLQWNKQECYLRKVKQKN